MKTKTIILITLIFGILFLAGCANTENKILGKATFTSVGKATGDSATRFCKIFGRTDAVKGTLMEAGDIPAGFIVPATGSGCMSDTAVYQDQCAAMSSPTGVINGMLVDSCINDTYAKCSSTPTFVPCNTGKICVAGTDGTVGCVAKPTGTCNPTNCVTYTDGIPTCQDRSACYVTSNGIKVFSECLNPGVTDKFLKYDNCLETSCRPFYTSCTAKNGGTGWNCYNLIDSTGKYAQCSKTVPAGKCATQADCVSKLGFSTKCDSTGKKVLVPQCDFGTSKCVAKTMVDCGLNGTVCSNGACTGSGGGTTEDKSCAVVTEDETIRLWDPNDDPGRNPISTGGKVPVNFGGFIGGINSGGEVSIDGVKLSTKVSITSCGEDSSGNPSGAKVIARSARCPFSYYSNGKGECYVKCGNFNKTGTYNVHSSAAEIGIQCKGYNVKTFKVVCNADNQCEYLTNGKCNLTTHYCEGGSIASSKTIGDNSNGGYTLTISAGTISNAILSKFNIDVKTVDDEAKLFTTNNGSIVVYPGPPYVKYQIIHLVAPKYYAGNKFNSWVLATNTNCQFADSTYSSNPISFQMKPTTNTAPNCKITATYRDSVGDTGETPFCGDKICDRGSGETSTNCQSDCQNLGGGDSGGGGTVTCTANSYKCEPNQGISKCNSTGTGFTIAVTCNTGDTCRTCAVGTTGCTGGFKCVAGSGGGTVTCTTPGAICGLANPLPCKQGICNSIKTCVSSDKPNGTACPNGTCQDGVCVN